VQPPPLFRSNWVRNPSMMRRSIPLTRDALDYPYLEGNASRSPLACIFMPASLLCGQLPPLAVLLHARRTATGQAWILQPLSFRSTISLALQPQCPTVRHGPRSPCFFCPNAPTDGSELGWLGPTDNDGLQAEALLFRSFATSAASSLALYSNRIDFFIPPLPPVICHSEKAEGAESIPERRR
jgi:hypothetical protein